MGHIFRLECAKCNELMRFDQDHYDKFEELTWHCWKCWYGVKTLDLAKTVIQTYPSELEA